MRGQRRIAAAPAFVGVLCVLTLVGCDGVRGASNFAKREAFSASFEQIPLVASKGAGNRTLQMFVFTDQSASAVRGGYNVPFSVAVDLP